MDDLYWTGNCLSVKYDLSNKNKEEGGNCLSLNCKPLCQIRSKACETYKKTQEQYSFFQET